MEIRGKMRKVELLPTRDCEAGYAPGDIYNYFSKKSVANFEMAHKK